MGRVRGGNMSNTRINISENVFSRLALLTFGCHGYGHSLGCSTFAGLSIYQASLADINRL